MRTHTLSPGRGVKLTIHLSLAPRLRMLAAKPPFPTCETQQLDQAVTFAILEMPDNVLGRNTDYFD